MRVERFTEAHLDDAAELLAERHRAQRTVEPLLDAAYENATACRVEVERLFAIDDASGAVAHRDGRLVAYLLGTPRPAPSPWGPNVWVEAAGHAATDPEAVRDLYAACAGGWVERGLVAHYALVPATEPALVDAWFRLSFGAQHAHALRAPALGSASDARVRPATDADIDELAALDPLLELHQQNAPVFSTVAPQEHAQSLTEWAESFADAESAAFVAELDGRIVGCSYGCPVERSTAHSTLARPPRAGMLAWAVVVPEARGLGLGRALGDAVLDWSARRGDVAVVTDWRVTNLISSRTWPALGFRPTFTRVHRLIAA